MKKLLLLSLAVLMGSTLVHAQSDPNKTNAGSIYDTGFNDAYLDRVARKKGDILLVLIDESSVANFAADTTTTKATTNATTSTVLSMIDWAFGPFTNSVNSSNAGTGKTDQASQMTAKVSVMVKEVDSAGNLQVEGTRSLVTNKETQTFVLSGLVRPFDIAPDNSVPSSKLANAQIHMAGKGQIADRQRKGLLTTILDWIF